MADVEKRASVVKDAMVLRGQKSQGVNKQVSALHLSLSVMKKMSLLLLLASFPFYMG
jgi:hypothetical protein